MNFGQKLQSVVLFPARFLLCVLTGGVGERLIAVRIGADVLGGFRIQLCRGGAFVVPYNSLYLFIHVPTVY